MRSSIFFICLILCFGLYSCIKAPEYPIEPHIEFKSFSNDYILTEQLDTITFSFTDGDGDISTVDQLPDSVFKQNCDRLKAGDSSDLRNTAFNVFLITNSTLCIDAFRTGNVTSTGKYKGISGDIQVIQRISSGKCVGPKVGCPDDTIVYTILLKDKAGHFSNFIQTPPLRVRGEP